MTQKFGRTSALLIPAVVALALAATPPSIAQTTAASPICSRFTAPAAATHPVVVIDLASGLQVSGETSFDAGQQVEVRLINANPFAWEYKVEQAVTVDSEGDLSAFLNAFFPAATKLASPQAPEKASGDAQRTAGPPPPPSPPTPAPAAALVCDDDSVDQKRMDAKIQEGVDALKAARKDVKRAIEKLASAVEVERSALAMYIQALSQAADCQTIVGHAMTIGTTQLQKVEDLTKKINALKTSLDNLRREIEAQKRRLDAYANGLYELRCSPSTVRREIEEIETNLASYSAYLQAAGTDLAAATKSQSDLRKLIKAVEDTLDRPDAFGRTFEVTGPDDPGKVTITTFRKKLSDEKFPDKPYIEKELRFGGRPRFAMAVGVAFASLMTRDYASVQGFALDEQGAFVLDDAGERQLTSVVGLEDGSDHRISPLVALHTRIGKPWWIFSGTHLTLGLTAKADDGLNAEYLVGISLSFAGEKAFLTFGAYNGRVESLREGFYEGRALPTDLTELPVRKDRKWDFAVALSYKFR